jgi:hypothetical protein
MHACDIHFPYENEPAPDIFYQLFDHVQPQVCAVSYVIRLPYCVRSSGVMSCHE